jgi:hypothetical protein
MTYLKAIRDAAMACSNIDYRAVLRDVADGLDADLARLADNPTEEAMIAANASWARAARVMKNIPPEADPSPFDGWTEPARLAA